jgi:hypothetical protein
MMRWPRLLPSFGSSWRNLLFTRVPFRLPKAGQVVGCLSALGCGGLIYLLGASVMFFQLPSSHFLEMALSRAGALNKRGRSSIPLLPDTEEETLREGVTVDRPSQTCDGFTLYTTTQAARAYLLDMRGREVHRWELPFSRAWPQGAPHVPKPLADEQIHWFRCHLYPNGDLLAVYHADGDTPYGYGLVKVDKDSNLLWAYANNVHHDVDVSEDGTIYTLAQRIIAEPPAGLNSIPGPYIADFLVVLSPQGKELESIPILDAFLHSPYALTLASVSNFATPAGIPPHLKINPPTGSAPRSDAKGDLFHCNSVRILGRSLAPKFPQFQAGHVLLSVRNLDTIAVVDRQKRCVSWAAQGLWKIQHDAKFLENGHLLLFDNFGLTTGSRVIEYDPRTQATPWSYANENSPAFLAYVRGMSQRLTNGNTLILDPDHRRLFEVTSGKELVWECFCPLAPAAPGQRRRAHAVTGARRYCPGELTFLGRDLRARNHDG